ncbi:serine hydrolase domain-containing protein [Flavobacterium selenitireducens]|uniref:serine hydrolase domain-containing protein n=1 Tax=Flavobacterium selenitireducens TaxID=2722704 RepID=UPI00168B3BB4|nr:serine hydrolase [Flavobacterium selenitireducens]MBD3583729.1 serine hydrolase [Flavobacterium selenitireducens]
MKKRYWLLLTVAILVVFALGWNFSKMDLIAGFAAKSVASHHFGDGRSLQTIEAGDNDIPLVDLATNSIDERMKSAKSSVFGLMERTAIWREGLGSVLIDGDFDVTAPYNVPKRHLTPTGLPFPYGDLPQKDTVFQNIDYDRLQRAIDNAFDKKGEQTKRTRALLVIYDDHIIGEKYAPGFTKDSKLLGWSMTKSITATMFGILEYQKRFDCNKPAPVAEWQQDERKNITVSNLLKMNSGLKWDENYETISDATKMLFVAKDMTRVQLEKGTYAAPGKDWCYSSGTTNLLSGILRKQFRSHQQYLDFWYSELIDKIGMHSMFIETDMSGNYVGSSYGWATARDWAKFGLLYLHEGNWNGQRIFDKSWVDFVTTPTKGSHGKYGAHFWLNSSGFFADAPRDMYSANGFQGQKIFIIPSKGLVIVRLGLAESFGSETIEEIVGSVSDL